MILFLANLLAIGHGCFSTHGQMLWNKDSRSTSVTSFECRHVQHRVDWYLLQGYINLHDACNLLGGHLPRNNYERRIIFSCFQQEEDHHRMAENYVDMVEELLDMHDEPPTPTSEWARDGLYCTQCMKELIRQRFRRWWLTKKQSSMSSSSFCIIRLSRLTLEISLRRNVHR